MCFRPPTAEAGEVVCPSCYIVAEPNPDGTCPECGAVMRKPQEQPGAPSVPSVPGAAAPASPGAPASPAPPKAPGGPMAGA